MYGLCLVSSAVTFDIVEFSKVFDKIKIVTTEKVKQNELTCMITYINLNS